MTNTSVKAGRTQCAHHKMVEMEVVCVSALNTDQALYHCSQNEESITSKIPVQQWESREPRDASSRQPKVQPYHHKMSSFHMK
jgi:hypothetical protein